MIEFTPIPVEFELERFGSASIDLHEWMRLRKHALEFVVGKGVNATSFTCCTPKQDLQISPAIHR